MAGRTHGELLNVCVFGAASIHGRALGFHVLTENGAVIWRLPLHAFCHKPGAPMQPLDWLQFWDCFSYEVTVTTFERLQDSRVRVQFKDRSWEGGQYMFTLDWCESEDAEEAGLRDEYESLESRARNGNNASVLLRHCRHR